ncbi:hypothetical protein C6496_03140 [Candidatus Poribacteria bacterium]|nr:MAG: hypothetical protein C6496_03140 [Candidatus Poribacteria bacterium]
MPRIEITTKPNGAGRNWLEVGHFETDTLGRKQWIKKNVPHQESKLTVDRQYSARGETIDWIVIIPENYPFSLAKVTYDRLNPKEIEVLWDPEGTSQTETNREEKIKRVYELAAGNDELVNLLKELLTP